MIVPGDNMLHSFIPFLGCIINSFNMGIVPRILTNKARQTTKNGRAWESSKHPSLKKKQQGCL